MAISYDEYVKKRKKNQGYYESEKLIKEYLSSKKETLKPSDYNDIAPVKKDTWFSKGAFNDGYDFGDVTKTLLGTVGDIGSNAFQGFLGLGEGLVDLAMYNSSRGLKQGVEWSEKLGLLENEKAKEKAEEFKKRAEGIKSTAQKNTVQGWFKPVDDFVDKYSVIGEKGDQVSQGLGQVAGIIVTGGAGSAAGLSTLGTTALTTAVTGLSGAGSGMGEAYNSGATDEEAAMYGLIAGTAEAGTELIFGGLGKSINAVGLSTGLSSADDMLAKKISSKISNQVAKNFVEYGVKASAEGSEEVMSGILQAIGKKVTYMSEEELSKIIADEQLLDQFIIGTVTSGIAQSGYVPGMTQGSLREANKSGRDFITGYTQSEQKAIDKEVESRKAEAQKQGKKLSKKEIVKIEEQVVKDLFEGNLSTTPETKIEETNIKAEESVESIDNQIVELEKQLMTTENDAEYERISNEIRVLEEKANQMEQQNIAPVQKNAQKTENIVQNSKEILEKTKKNISDQNIEMVDTNKLLKYREFDRLNQDKNKTDEELNVLKEDIVANGIKNPINIVYNPETGQAFINEGNTRLAIAESIGLEQVPTIVTRTTDSTQFEGKNVMYLPKEKGDSEHKYLKPSEISSEFISEANENTTQDIAPVKQNTKKTTEKDNNGRVLTVEGQEKLKDSKVRDENGNLMLMYHGSPNGTYEKLRGGTYFTKDYKYAERYKNPSASSISYGKTENNPRVYEAYLNIKKPFNINDSEARDIYINEYVKGGNALGINPYLSDAEYNKIDNIDWTEVEDLKNFLEENGYDYDGIVSYEGADGGYGQDVIERGESYIPFNEEQIINVDEVVEKVEGVNSDVENDITPISQELSDLKDELKDTIKNTKNELKSLKKEIKEVKTDINEAVEDFKALTEADLPMLEEINQARLNSITDEDIAPMQEDTTPEADNEITSTKSLEDVRDFDEVGSRKVKAYQYENPEVRPYFQEMATYMLGDLENSVKGERSFNDQLYYDTAGEQGFYGTTRQTTDDIAELLDSKYNYTYKDIRKGLEAIIEDHGAENIAVAKRIEFALDKRLREGYTDVSGYEIPANEEYLKLMEAKEINDYYDSLPIDESMIPPEEDIAPVVNASNTKVKENIAPVRRNIDWDSIEDTSQGNQIALNEEGETVEIISELEKKQQREYKKLGSKEDYISNKAYELYDEVKNLKKGVKASYELGRVLDVAFANINELTDGMTPTEAKEVKNAIWRDVTTSLLNVKAKPLSTVNRNSTIEAVIRQNINREYDSKKNEIANMKEEDLVTKTKKELRKELLIDESDFFINALDNAKNRSMALMNNTDTIRNTELVFGRENGRKINEIIFQKEIDNEADSIAWQNKERQEIKELGIKARSKESAAVQKYGEKQYVETNGELVSYTDEDLVREFPNVETQEKIKNAAKVIRNKYDNYIDTANGVLTKLGFDPIPKRKDYMRHFQELNDVFSRYGIPFNAQSMTEHVLPTDINGLTENWSPQKNYFANTQQRKGLKTTYDAITGVDGYIGGIANLIYHTEDIQRGRAFEELIRETYGEDKGFENLDNLPDELKQARAEKIQDNHLSNYAAWVHEWTNNVAGKKSKIDRSVESMFGRKAFSFLDGARKQVGSNMIGFNLSSSLTNLIAPVQAMAKTNKLAVLKGTADTIKNMFIKDDFMSKNKFLTSRMGTDMLSKNAWQKIQDAGFIFMKGMDWFSSNQIVRSKYYELRAKGMSEQQAHSEAGQFAARIMGDRTKGANAQLYNSKLVGLVTQFQLEVNNQLYSMFYDTYHESKENAQNNAVRTTAGMTFTLGQLFVFTHLFGKTFEAIAGYNPTFDVIGMLATALGWGEDDDEEKTTSERLKDAADQLVDALPYVNILTGGGRIPVASGIPNLVGVATGGKDEYGNELTLEDELKKLLFLVPPTGGNQVKKTTQGLSMFDEDLPVSGSYTDSGNLRFPVEDTPLNRLQAGLFGQWANENARDYFDNERQPLKEKQIQEFKDLDMPISEYWEYREGLKDKSKTEEKFEYINSLDVSDEQKNIMINNALTRKEQVDMSGYDDFGSYEEFDFATKNPEKYEIISQIDTYDNYVSYEEDIASIKEQFSNENGYSTTERKQAVFQYINSLRIGIPQKIMLMKMAGGYSIKSYSNDMFEYINSLPMTIEEKERMYNQLFD